MGGATGYLGDAVIFQRHNMLWLPVADGATIALLSVLIVTPGIHL